MQYLIIAHDRTPEVHIAVDDGTAQSYQNNGLITVSFQPNQTVRIWTQQSSASFSPPEEVFLPKLKIFRR